MAAMTLPTGELETPVYKVRYTFRIRGFDNILRLGNEAKKEQIKSPLFGHPDTPDVQWRIDVYPFGHEKKVKGQVSAFLTRKDNSDEGHMAEFNLWAGQKKRDKMKHKFIPEEKDWGFSHFMPHDAMEYEEAGVFAVTAEVEYAWGEPKSKTIEPLKPQPPSLLPLLYSAWLSDFSLEVEGEAVPVHRNILSVASPVFRRMFAQHMSREAQSHTAVLQDTSMAAVKTMLRFVYTGRIDEGEEDQEGKKDTDAKAKDKDTDTDKEGSGDESGSDDKQGTSETKTKPAPTAEDVGELCEVLALAHRYDMAGLGRAAEAQLMGLLGQATLLPVAAAANLHDFPDLLQACREEVRSGRVELKDWEEFAKAQHDLIPKLTLPSRST